jgi:Skp family chaperone for outer membrane proteins
MKRPSFPHRLSLAILLVCAATCLAAVAICVPAAAAARTALAPPTAVAVVNLPRVLDQLDQRQDAKKALDDMAAQLDARDKEWRAEIDALEKRQAEVADEAERQKAFDELTMKRLQHQGWFKFAREQLDIETSLSFQQLDRAVLEAVSALAKANGYDIVLLDDSSRSLETRPDQQIPREMQVRQAILSRHVLYTNSTTVDITDQLVERMNNAW